MRQLSEVLMPDFDLILSRGKIRNRKLSVLIGHSIVGIVDNSDVTLHPAMDCALHIDGAGLLEFPLVHLALNRLRDVEEAVVSLKELNVVQYRVAVPQRDFAVHSHDLNMG